MNREPIIRALPTEEKFKELVDLLITPETADEEAKAFCDIILTVANPEDDHSFELAKAAARHAYSKTHAFEEAFREFTGFPNRPLVRADRVMIHAGDGVN